MKIFAVNTIRRIRRATFFFTGLLLLLPSVARSDQIRLDNGDILTGTVKGVVEGKLKLSTSYAGDLSITTSNIVGVETAKSFNVRWKDGREEVGRLITTAAGQIELISAANEAPASGEANVSEPALASSAQDDAVGTAEPRPIVLDQIASVDALETFYRYKGNLGAGVTLSRGNTDTTDIHVDATVAPSFGPNTVTLTGQINRSKAEGILTASNWRIQASYDRTFGRSERWYLTAFNSYSNDEFQDLDLRIEAGLGAGYEFFKAPPTLLKISLGPTYVNDKYVDEPQRNYVGVRWNLDFEQDLWGDNLKLYHNDQITVGLSETEFFFYTTTGLKFALGANLSLSTEVQWNYNAEPADDALKSDERYILKIGYDFKGDENDWWDGW